MADKRMFSKSIVLSDAFLDMPPTSRCLYFTLSMSADDDGFVNSPKSIMRQCGASEDDFKVLVAKKFIIPFDSGVIVIKHWRLNNYLRGDRHKPTKYLEEMAELKIEQNGSYTLAPQNPAPARVALLDRVPKNDMEKVEKAYLENYDRLYRSGVVKLEKPVINWNASRKLTKDCLEKYGLDVILSAIKKSVDNKFVVSKGYVLTMILSAGILSQLINSSDGRIDNDRVSSEAEINF